jgi:hypothetical protein
MGEGGEMVVATVTMVMTTTTMTMVLRSKHCRRWRGQQALTFIASCNDNAAAATMAQHSNQKMTGVTATYTLMDGKSATTDAIRSNPLNLTQQSAVRDGGEE